MMPRLSQKETGPEQPLPVVRVCWDELFDFLRDLFRSKKTRAWTALNNLDAETSTNYKKVLSVEVESGFEGLLQDISLYSSEGDTTEWALQIAGQTQFTDKKIFVALTLNYGGMIVHTGQKILVWAKTDGAATNIAASLSGQLQYLATK
ncbi:unnamed protein product [marine sediment metagenome]|uniref:Uncharacterized protein n=1 Tax=marine sediment metagenome TaxID=412755 RepID=X1TFP2_9ZZZZ